MAADAALAAVDAGFAGGVPPQAWLLTGVVLALAFLGHRRLPAGVRAGLFLVAGSAVVMLACVALGPARLAREFATAAWAALAALWFAIGVRYRWAQARGGSLSPTPGVEASLCLHGATVAGLLAAALVVSSRDGGAGRMLWGSAVVGGMLILALVRQVMARDALSRQAAVGLLVLLIWLWVPREVVAARAWSLSLVLLGGSGLALATIVVTVLADWRRRVRVWREHPEELTVPAARHWRSYSTAVGICVAAGVGAVLVVDALLTPLAAGLAALACLTVSHRWRSDMIGEIGMGLVAVAAVSAVRAWLPASSAALLMGWALAGVYLLWLARFWDQQLNDGRPWTTAGRLIPAARSLSYVTVGGQVVAVVAWFLGPSRSGWGGWQAVGAVLLMLVQWWMLTREASRHADARAALASCLVLLVALLPTAQVCAGLIGVVPGPAVMVAAGGLLIAVRTGGAGRDRPLDWVYNAYLGAVVPVLVGFELLDSRFWVGGFGGAAVAVGVALLAVGIRWGRRASDARDAAR